MGPPQLLQDESRNPSYGPAAEVPSGDWWGGTGANMEPPRLALAGWGGVDRSSGKRTAWSIASTSPLLPKRLFLKRLPWAALPRLWLGL